VAGRNQVLDHGIYAAKMNSWSAVSIPSGVTPFLAGASGWYSGSAPRASNDAADRIDLLDRVGRLGAGSDPERKI
ncbi:MAG TPA: hypothetical protein VL475_14515, partial [Planctomycetaceae bacterium]|nr:hypothetical protein [Planctomycetaceae bacterium]